MAERVPFRAVVEFAIGGGWGEAQPGPGRVPVAVIRGADFPSVAAGRFCAVPRRFEAAAKAARRLLVPGDLLLEISGGSSARGRSTGRSLLVTDEVLEGLSGAVIPASFCRLLRVDRSVVNPRYAYYALQEMHRSGRAAHYENPSTGISNFQFDAFLDHEAVRLPPLAEQEAVAALLGALDAKISVNRRIAGTARELGLALFIEAVQRPGSTEMPLQSAAALLTRGVTPRYADADADGGVTVVNQRCVRHGRVALEAARCALPGGIRSAKLLRRNDVLVNSTGVGTLGRVARWTFDEVQATADSHLTIVRFDEQRVDPVCAGFALLHAQPRIEAMGEGSTGQTELRRTDLGALHIAVPSRGRQRELRPALDALEARADRAIAESRSLAALRDTLLAPLMSGGLRVAL